MIEMINLILGLVILCVAVITLTIVVVKFTKLQERLQRFEDYNARRSQDKNGLGVRSTNPDGWGL